MSQAAIALRADSACANPIETNDDGQSGQLADRFASTTRRGVLAGLMLASAGAATAAAMPVLAEPDTSKWKEAVARYRAAERQSDRYVKEVYNPAVGECWHRTGPLPDIVFYHPTPSGVRSRYHFDLSNRDKWTRCAVPEVRAWAISTRAAYEKFDRASEQAKIELGMDAVEAEDDRLYGIACRLQNDVLKTPVPDVAALMEKLEICWTEERDGEVLREHIFRDVAFLARRPAQA